MPDVPRYSAVRVGDRLPRLTHTIRRYDLVRYAGASGDFNPIHWSESAAEGAGLPGLVAHGMLTFGVAMRLVNEWAGRPGRVSGCGARFTRPVVVPDGYDGTEVVVEGVVAEKLPGSRVRIDLTVRHGGEKVLARPRAVVALDD
ncbi:MaoC/PaaZ C-terminal domain-containing protein [Microbispora sp. ATCC PTA-5024]|uniref:MaoC/PaaZ C-terminal domain-containing protein n=1 Tax=Microbispora sp. ATCC PTA-5024 TaxID=316330 RepID=UPI0003DCE5CF|nr:MaoC/PaaZ C-terminal domain-containing protein [Microbispora sp. ATCC PTA-5024]ETK36545.1 MaoC family dehydratase [Microbispora sp. ATCC PTA-5024]